MSMTEKKPTAANHARASELVGDARAAGMKTPVTIIAIIKTRLEPTILRRLRRRSTSKPASVALSCKLASALSIPAAWPEGRSAFNPITLAPREYGTSSVKGA